MPDWLTGHLILEFSFSWYDILAYAVGILAGIILEYLITANISKPGINGN
ncbi:MAG: hypothetical protein M0Q38_05850 [Bacteroidales bacterium]|nr:hypothetical protein [Bacteroidales bacterium]